MKHDPITGVAVAIVIAACVVGLAIVAGIAALIWAGVAALAGWL